MMYYSSVVPAATAFILVTYFIIKPLADYFRDPKGLRKYPSINPVAGITNLGFMYEAAKGHRSDKLSKLHQKHPVVRIGPNSLSFSGCQAIRDIYGHGTPCVKDEFYRVLAGTHYHLADVIDKPDHARKRKVLSAAYGLKNLEMWEHKVTDKTERFIKQADRSCTPPLSPGTTKPKPKDVAFDYRAFTNFFTLDAISDIGFSESLGFLDTGNDETIGERMDGTLYTVPSFRDALYATAQAQSHLIWAYNWYKINRWLSKLVPKYNKLWRLNQQWNDIVYHRTKKRLARYLAGEKLPDFFQSLMEDRNGEPHNLELGELAAECSIMLNAGSDTTALALANVMLHLLRNPEALRKLRDEIDGVLSPDEVVASYDKVKYLPYLRAVLDESMRITPPNSFGLPRRTPRDGHAIAQEFIPGDTSVSISAWVAHRDETVFPEADRFVPERWLGEKGRDLQAGFIPFSTGARGCIGRNISYLEQTVFLASVVHRYDMALQSPDWQPVRYEATTYQMVDMPVKIWRRELNTSANKSLLDND